MTKTDKSNPALQLILHAIGKKIRAEREKLGYSQETLAEKAGFHRTYIGMVERGEQNLTLDSYSRFADALGIGLFDLMHDTLKTYHTNNQDNENSAGFSINIQESIGNDPD